MFDSFKWSEEPVDDVLEEDVVEEVAEQVVDVVAEPVPARSFPVNLAKFD